MNKLFCMNCYQDKTLDRLANMYCLACETAANEADEYAKKENLDQGTMRKQALASRAPRSMDHKHPGMEFQRIDTSAWDKRIAIKPGSIEDPRRK